MKLGETVLINLVWCDLVLVVVMLIDLIMLGFLSLALFLWLDLVSLRTWMFLAFHLVVGAVYRNFNLRPRMVPWVSRIYIKFAKEVHLKVAVEVSPLVAKPATHQVEAVLVLPAWLSRPPISPADEQAGGEP